MFTSILTRLVKKIRVAAKRSESPGTEGARPVKSRALEKVILVRPIREVRSHVTDIASDLLIALFFYIYHAAQRWRPAFK
jgi:hypothetical protein